MSRTGAVPTPSFTHWDSNLLLRSDVDNVHGSLQGQAQALIVRPGLLSEGTPTLIVIAILDRCGGTQSPARIPLELGWIASFQDFCGQLEHRLNLAR